MMAVASYPVEILETAGQITMIAEAFSEVRRVFMDQPQLPIDEVPPGYYGHSVGRWDGETLVIDTVGIKESVPGYQNIPHSDQMRITERLRLLTPDVLHDQITIDDPVVLEKPVVYTLAYRRLRDYKMVEFVCDNNREYVDAQGRVRMRLGGGSRLSRHTEARGTSGLARRSTHEDEDDQDDNGNIGADTAVRHRRASTDSGASGPGARDCRSVRWPRRIWPSRVRSLRST